MPFKGKKAAMETYFRQIINIKNWDRILPFGIATYLFTKNWDRIVPFGHHTRHNRPFLVFI